MSQYQPPWPPQEPQFYAQPTGGLGLPQPPRKKSRVKLILAIVGGVLALTCALCSLAAYAGGTIKTTVAPTATPTHAILLVATATPTRVLVVQPTATPTTKPTATPTMKPTPTQKPVPKPTPKPQPTACVGVNGNPWCYNFTPGNRIYSPNSAFCDYFTCVSTFWTATSGYVAECADGHYTHSGGVRGACSHNGGVLRPLYQH